MTTHTDTNNVLIGSQAETQDLFRGEAEAKWPIPYAAMFMVTLSVGLWYGIITAGSALMSVLG